jgi:predicted phage replisome organizer
MEVKWIKIVTDIFDNRKIRQIEVMPDGDSILVIWFKLICLAGRINDNGLVYVTEDIPYTDEMLAAQFNRPLATVRLALNIFQKFKMIEIVNDFLCLPSWEKYQSADRLEKMKSKNAERQARFKAKKRAELNAGKQEVTLPVTLPVTHGNAIEEDKEEEIDKERDIDITSTNVDVCSDDSPEPTTEHRKPVPYEQIRKLYNDICHSFPACRVLSENRKKAIKARFAAGYTVEDFQTLFQKAEDSSFLKGQNNRNWTATLDWLIKDGNIAKVLDGNYDDHGRGSGTTTPQRQDDLDFIPD